MSTSTSSKLPPLTTLGFTVLMVAIFVWEQTMSSLSSPSQGRHHLQMYTMCPRNVFYLLELYRVITSCLWHANMMHLGMNMMSFWHLGRTLEQRQGTLPMFVLLWWTFLWTSTIYLIISYFAYLLVGYEQWMYQHSVGFSGVLFHLAVLECSTATSTRSVFGFINVPATVYPWVLLMVLQFIMPNLSFVGHLSGILTGTMQSWGWLDIWFLPSQTYWIQLEQQLEDDGATTSVIILLLRKTRNLDGYILASDTPWATSSISVSRHCIIDTVYRILWNVKKGLSNVAETIVVCIFGRGHHLNSNIRILWSSRRDALAAENDLELQRHQNSDSSTTSNTNFPPGGGRRLGGRSSCQSYENGTYTVDTARDAEMNRLAITSEIV